MIFWKSIYSKLSLSTVYKMNFMLHSCERLDNFDFNKKWNKKKNENYKEKCFGLKLKIKCFKPFDFIP